MYIIWYFYEFINLFIASLIAVLMNLVISIVRLYGLEKYSCLHCLAIKFCKFYL